MTTYEHAENLTIFKGLGNSSTTLLLTNLEAKKDSSTPAKIIDKAFVALKRFIK